MKMPLEYSRVPIAPSHKIGEILSRSMKLAGINVLRSRIQDVRVFCICAAERCEREIQQKRSAIIHFFASKSLSFMLFGVPGLKRAIIYSVVIFVAVVFIASCGSGSKATTSGLSYRAFVSNPLLSGIAPVLQIVNAQNDTLPGNTIGLTGELVQPSMMTLSPSRRYTLVYSPTSPAVALVDNTKESLAENSSGSAATTSISLPGMSESMFIANDNATGYVAVPSAPTQAGQTLGAVLQLALLNGSISASIPIPSAHYIASNGGNEILVFSDNSDAITIISSILVGTNANPLTVVQSPNLDRPVGAIFSADGTAAYILNCGAECGGKQASVAVLQLSSNTVSTPLPVQGATTALLSGSTLFVAGSAPNTPCGSGTAAKNCGSLNMININSMTLINSSPISITDGWHNHLELSSDGQLFIGARTCSNVNISGGEVRGCLTIYNTTAATTIFPPFVGDVTGIAPILGRNIVYVVQNAGLNIFDTTTDQIEVQSPQPLFLGGLPFDVKYVDAAIPN